MDGVAKKLLYWGFNSKGEVLEAPQKISGGYSFRGEVGDDPDVLGLWDALKKAVQQKGIEVVVEEAAYTWFNRLMALRIMAKNGYEPSLLQNTEGLEHTPLLLQKARQGQFAFLNATEQVRLKKMIGDYSKDQETFALLLVGYCHSNKMLNTVFGKLDDYTELLLPDTMLQESGFLYLLNTTDAISDEEYKQVELIGWLYQFYISEKKDDVFASFKKGKKAEAKDIPAATQIFTPNWIVKYMVENTVGKLWLDKHPDSPIKDNMKYLVINESDASNLKPQTSNLINSVEDLTLLDPAVGSGHILVEGFDLLYQMYMEAYYTPEEAVASILKNNLYGLDLDDRAAQLANFAILLKAATKYRDVFTKGWMPNVYAMPESKEFSTQDLKDFLGEEGKDYLDELDSALYLMKQAKNLGSVMKLTLSAEAYSYIQKRYQSLQKDDYLDINLESILQGLKAYIPILLILTKKFAAVVANPPYMGQKNMNAGLKNYLNSNYPLSKSDLFAVFMEAMIEMLQDNARVGCITMESWMFLSSYEKFRNHLLENYSIASLAHFGWHIIGIAFGTAVLILEKSKNIKIGEYSYLTINDVDREKNIPFEFPKKNNGRFARIPQTNFSKIPGSPIGYWIGKAALEVFRWCSLGEFAIPQTGLQTSDNKRFVRFWSEVDYNNIHFNCKSITETNDSQLKWFPYNKGGSRKWAGDHESLVNWQYNGKELKEFNSYLNSTRTSSIGIGSTEYFFREGVTVKKIGSGGFSARYLDSGYIFDAGGSVFFSDQPELLIALLNSKIASYMLNILNPTVNFQVGDIKRIPFHPDLNKNEKLVELEKQIYRYSINDWNSREVSWEFEQSPLLNETANLKEAYDSWLKDVTQDFFQLHANEEELNRIFIDIYGLKEELTTEVALKDITILQEELKSKDLERLESAFRKNEADAIDLPINKAEVISQFISYAIGLFMGRYRLDKKGLQIAHPNSSVEEIEAYTYNGKKVNIDEDAILPLMGTECNFSDDILQRVYEVLDIIWGPKQRTENINFIQKCLDKDLERFLVKDFYKYHCSMYKKKPIYWLFASPKGAFQVLVYMHRMNAFTVEKIRANYLLEHLKKLRSEETMLAANDSSLNTQEAKRLDQVRKDIVECETYDMELKDMADAQIAFDLDDGVAVNYAKFKTVVAKI
jgi:hypothetical protein